MNESNVSFQLGYFKFHNYFRAGLRYLSFLGEIFGDPIQTENDSDEIDLYLNSACERTAPNEYWQKHEESYPKLSKLARQILSVPASSASVERGFSLIRRLIGDNRTSLNPESVSNLLKIHYSYSS